MTNLRKSNLIHSLKTTENDDSEISYEVDSPHSSLNSYLQRFLWKKQEESHVKQLITRPKSAPLGDFTCANSRINIGITLDSRLRKTPVFDMLRSTMMESPRSKKNCSIARF